MADEIKQAEVKSIRMSGADVILDNGEEAWLPAAEVTEDICENGKFDFTKYIKKHDRFKVKIIGESITRDRKIVSKYRVYKDPWDVTKKWKPDAIKRLKITSVSRQKAFGEIEKGIDGYVQFNELDPMIPEKFEEFKIIMAGDYLAGKICNIDDENRLIKLDVGSFINESIFLLSKSYNKDSFRDELSFHAVSDALESDSGSDTMTTFPQKDISNAFLVDDDSKLLNSLADCFRTIGVDTIQKSTKKRALEFLRENEDKDFDIALIDIHLTHTNDYHGLEIAAFIQENRPMCKIVITTGFELKSIDIYNSNATELRISGYLEKPFSFAMLRKALESGLSRNPEKLNSFIDEKKLEKVEEIPLETINIGSLIGEIQRVKSEIHATTVCLFSINPLSYEVVLEGISGPKKNYLKYRHKLRYSPVRDVAIDREEINLRNVAGSIPKHRYLYWAFLYHSCIALPLNVPSELAFCLFAFHDDPNIFSESDYYKFKISVERISRIIENERLYEITLQEAPFIMAGKAYGTLGHELNTKLTFLNMRISYIKKKINDLKLKKIVSFDKLSENILEMHESIIRSQEIVQTFRKMALGQHEKVDLINIKNALIEASLDVKNEINAMNTDLIINEITEDLPLVKGRYTAVVQLFYNLILNAAQQIHMFREVRNRGIVLIETVLIHEQDKPLIRILVHDTGPGIHGLHYNKIFQMGYTTKEGGLGLGLDIVKKIMDDLSGIIQVKRSTLFVGTTIELLIPGHVH